MGREDIVSQQQMVGGRIEALSDVAYDVIAELFCVSKGIDVLDTYIDDAKNAKDPEVARIFEQMRSDALRDAEALHDLMTRRVKQGVF